MTALEIFTEISDRQIKALIFHNDMANYFDFLGLNGFKRMHEYQCLSESAEMRGTQRYVINHINRLIPETKIENYPVIPNNWYNYSRLDVDMGTRKSAVKDAFMKWHAWETETLECYERKFKELSELGCIAHTNKVMDLICDVSQELKYLTRMILKYKATDWDMTLIEEEQNKLHDCYAEKMKHIGVTIV